MLRHMSIFCRPTLHAHPLPHAQSCSQPCPSVSQPASLSLECSPPKSPPESVVSFRKDASSRSSLVSLLKCTSTSSGRDGCKNVFSLEQSRVPTEILSNLTTMMATNRPCSLFPCSRRHWVLCNSICTANMGQLQCYNHKGRKTFAELGRGQGGNVIAVIPGVHD